MIKKKFMVILFLLAASFITVSFAKAIVVEKASETVAPNSYVLLRGSFHIHTTASDGEYSPTEVVKLFAEGGFDVIAITDHNTIDGYEEAQKVAEQFGMLVICGEEISCTFENGEYKHIIALFISKVIEIDWRLWRTEEVEAYFDAIHEQGGLGYVAHPWYTNAWTWTCWRQYQYADFIDGWAYPRNLASEWSGKWMYRKWVVRNDKIYTIERDYHQGSVLPGCYDVLMCHNRTLEGVREAFDSRRIVMNRFGTYYGSPEALSIFIQNEDVAAITVKGP